VKREMEVTMNRTWKPTVAGIINIAIGVIVIGYLIASSIGYNSLYGLVFLPLAIPPLVSGICALLRKVWWLALVGSFLSFPPGLISFILIILSYQEFKRPVLIAR
jgi:hypothetical protein